MERRVEVGVQEHCDWKDKVLMNSFVVGFIIILCFGNVWLFKQIELRDHEILEYEKLVLEMGNYVCPACEQTCEGCAWLAECPEGTEGPLCMMHYCQ
jgi:hypothetical protein